MLSEKLADMVASFSANHVEHFYAQLSALQCDINLVLRADPYRDGPLDDSKEDIDRLIATARDEICRSRAIAPEAESSFQALGGQFYAKFVQDINASMEERDKELTQAYQRHTDTVAALQRSASYKRQLAQEEHQLLSSTLRERLIQSVTAKRAKLLRDKEQLDIADSNALLLNPTQFSIGNPASPGGALSNRKTRHTRGRTDLADDPNENKRKRKAPFDEEPAAGSASPLPQSAKEPPASAHGPVKDAKARLASSQFEAPLYSIDRLFSEKELALNLNRAYLQTNDYFTKLRAQGLENRLNVATSASLHAADPAEPPDGPTDPAAPDDDDLAATGPASPSPTAKEPAHATRSHRAAAPEAAAAYLAQPPPYGINIHISTSASKTNATAPQLPGLPDADAAGDLELMRQGPAFAGYEQLVERGVDRSWTGGVGARDGAAAGGVLKSGLDVLGDLAGVESEKGAVAPGKARALESVGMGRTMSAMSEGGRRARR